MDFLWAYMEVFMARTVGIGIQDFSTIIENKYFYVDKTSFIKEWWESGDSVTLITRPRRFGAGTVLVRWFFLRNLQSLVNFKFLGYRDFYSILGEYRCQYFD